MNIEELEITCGPNFNRSFYAYGIKGHDMGGTR
jgi:hypothetical protein